VARDLQFHSIQLYHNILKLRLFFGIVRVVFNQHKDISRIIEFVGI